MSLIKNGKYFSLPDDGDDDFKALFARAAAAGVGRPVDKDGCPQGPWTPELLAAAITQIDANRSGIELRTIQLWFKNNDKGISTTNIRWLARVFGCNDPQGASAWQAALTRSQARLAARRSNVRHKEGLHETDCPDRLPEEPPAFADCFDRRKGFSLPCDTEAIFSSGSPLNLSASVFAGAVALQFLSFFLSIHSITYIREDGVTKQVGFLWAPNWTVLFIALLPLFFAIVADLLTSWKSTGRPGLLAHTAETDQPDSWTRRVSDASYMYWSVFVLCVLFAGLLQWVSVRLLPVLNDSGDYAIDWGSLARVRPEEIGVVQQLAFTGVAYLYMCICFYLLISGLVLLATLAEDLAQMGKILVRQASPASLRLARAEGLKMMRGIFRATVVGLLVAMCMKLESLYVVTAAPNILNWLLWDAASMVTRPGTPVAWGEYSMPTHFTSLLVAVMVGAVYLYGAIRIGLVAPFNLPLARMTIAVLFLILVYLVIGVVTGFSVLLMLGIMVATYGLFDPNFSLHVKKGEIQHHVS